MRQTKYPNARILIADDQESNVLLLEGLVSEAGFQNYRGVSKPEQIIPLFTEFQPDLLLLDLAMPGMDGYTVMTELKKLIPPETYFPILVVTADVSTRMGK